MNIHNSIILRVYEEKNGKINHDMIIYWNTNQQLK